MPGGRGGIRCVCLRQSSPTTGHAVSGIALFAYDEGRDRRLSGGLCPQGRAPFRTGVKVDRLSKAGIRFEASWGKHTLFAENVVVSTACSIHREFRHSHTSSMRASSNSTPRSTADHLKFKKGAVLIVGAGNSGAEIASSSLPITRHGYPARTRQEPTRAGSHLDNLITPLMWL